jgi:PIN domain nuclease of toxin-antitoxin system
MTPRILDTSAVMAIVLDEPGREVAAGLAPGSVLSSVNLAEIITKCIEKSVPPEIAEAYIREGDIEIVDFDADLAFLAGDLFMRARKGVLSLGDRACLATAIKLKGTAVTADRVWAELALPCKVELIR